MKKLWLLVVIGLIGCDRTPVVKNGKLVEFNYTLTVDGKVFETSKAPVPYVQGTNMIVAGLEEQMTGLKVGDKKHVTISPEKGYGVLNPAAKQELPRTAFGKQKNLKVGMIVTGQNGGRPFRAKIIAVNKKSVTVDLNHPLAGKTLDFDVEVVSIKRAPPQNAVTVPNVKTQ